MSNAVSETVSQHAAICSPAVSVRWVTGLGSPSPRVSSRAARAIARATEARATEARATEARATEARASARASARAAVLPQGRVSRNGYTQHTLGKPQIL